MERFKEKARAIWRQIPGATAEDYAVGIIAAALDEERTQAIEDAFHIAHDESMECLRKEAENAYVKPGREAANDIMNQIWALKWDGARGSDDGI